jgi:uncharacterized protein YdiU (UPF0061 family)
MSVGFCHAVLNTDNMSITGESFDYGPYAFIDRYDPRFTAAYFDYAGRYSYGNQPIICQMNLKALQKPLKLVMPAADLDAALAPFKDSYAAHYHQRMLQKLGFKNLEPELATTLVNQTLELLGAVEVGYHDFFLGLTQQFSPVWREEASQIFSTTLQASDAAAAAQLVTWRQTYHRCLQSLGPDQMAAIAPTLHRTNPQTVLLRPEIEAIWEPITTDDNWQPFYDLLSKIQHPFGQG